MIVRTSSKIFWIQFSLRNMLPFSPLGGLIQVDINKKARTHLPHKPVHGVTQIFWKSLQFDGFFWLSGVTRREKMAQSRQKSLDAAIGSAATADTAYVFLFSPWFTTLVPSPQILHNFPLSPLYRLFRNSSWKLHQTNQQDRSTARPISPRQKKNCAEKYTLLYNSQNAALSTCLFSNKPPAHCAL